MTANSDEAAEPCNGSPAPDEDAQTRREHLQMWGAGLGLTTITSATDVDAGEGRVHDGDIWLYDEPLTVSPSLRLYTGPIDIDIPSTQFSPSDLEVRGWGAEDEVLIDVDGDYENGSVRPALVLDRETARQLAKRLLETTQWLADHQERDDDV